VRLSDLGFVDLYLGRERVLAKRLVGALIDPSPIPHECLGDASLLFSLCEKAAQIHPSGEFQIIHDGVAYRASSLQSKNELTFVLRRAEPEVMALDAIGLTPSALRCLMAPGLKGMILVCGPFGCGKTTTIAAITIARLKRFGGVAITIEDPTELPMDGMHGTGVCYQTEVTPERSFALGCKQAARQNPDIIFLGELRDRSAAIESQMAAINGRTVVSSMHASSIPSALERLTQMSGGENSSAEIASLLSAGLSAILYQEFVGNPKSLKTEFLFIPQGADGDGIRSLIKDQKFKQLSTSIQSQLAQSRFQS